MGAKMTEVSHWVSRHTSAAVSALAVLAALYAIAPGEWFVEFQLEVIPRAEQVDVVAQSRWMLLPRSFVARWHAEIERVDGFEVSAVPGCQGSGQGVYTVPAMTFVDAVPRWVGALDCALEPGELYRAAAVWEFALPFGLRKTTSAVSANFVAQ